MLSKKCLVYKMETSVFWHITEISAQNLVENDRMEVPHLFVHPNHQKSKTVSSLFGYVLGILSKFGQGQNLVKDKDNFESSQKGPVLSVSCQASGPWRQSSDYGDWRVFSQSLETKAQLDRSTCEDGEDNRRYNAGVGADKQFLWWMERSCWQMYHLNEM